MEEVYIDANVFIYGFLDKGEQGKLARAFLSKVSEGKVLGCTSTLTFDEVCWKLLKHLGRGEAEEVIDAFLSFPSLVFVDTDLQVIQEAAEVIKKWQIFPRDAIHLAACKARGISTIVSEDKDFDKVKSIRRKRLSDAAK